MFKPTILYITELFPNPPDSGAKIKSINTIQTLSKKFNIVLITFTDQKISPDQIEEISKFTIFHKIFSLPQLNEEPKNNLRKLIVNYMKLKPYYLYQFYSRPASNFISELVNKINFSAIHIDHLNMAQYLPKVKKNIWIYEEHNIESELAKSKFLNYPKLSNTKLFFLIEFLLTLLYEKIMVRNFDYLFAISPVDKELLIGMTKKNGVSLQKMVMEANVKNKKTFDSKNVLFIGDTSWHPNALAIEWFITKVWPKVLKKQPASSLHIVGKIEDQNYVQRLTNKNIYFHGYQKEIKTFLANASLFVLPFLSGSGVRVKALTALANQIPIVSTPIGVMGLELTAGIHYLPASLEDEFAHQCISILNNNKIAKAISSAGIIYIQENHSRKNNELFIKRYELIVRKSR